MLRYFKNEIVYDLRDYCRKTTIGFSSNLRCLWWNIYTNVSNLSYKLDNSSPEKCDIIGTLVIVI